LSPTASCFPSPQFFWDGYWKSFDPCIQTYWTYRGAR
jgi:hypothetical protein